MLCLSFVMKVVGFSIFCLEIQQSNKFYTNKIIVLSSFVMVMLLSKKCICDTSMFNIIVRVS